MTDEDNISEKNWVEFLHALNDHTPRDCVKRKSLVRALPYDHLIICDSVASYRLSVSSGPMAAVIQKEPNKRGLVGRNRSMMCSWSFANCS